MTAWWLLGLGVGISIVLLPVFILWWWHGRHERRIVRMLVAEASTLPRSLEDYTSEDRRIARDILHRAIDLPTKMPGDIREIPLGESSGDKGTTMNTYVVHWTEGNEEDATVITNCELADDAQVTFQMHFPNRTIRHIFRVSETIQSN